MSNKHINNKNIQSVLWSGDHQDMDDAVMRYLAGDDICLDQALFLYDIKGTGAHLVGLADIGIISDDECKQFLAALEQLKNAFLTHEFVLDQRFEDGHSAIEFYLTQELGELGKKAHTGRSRNDQVLTCLRLFMKDQMGLLKHEVAEVIEALLSLAEVHEHTLMPGYTHLQRAMPSTVAVWLLGFAESLLDNLQHLNHMMDLIDSSPLGTAAGFGVPLPLARQTTASEMGFSRVQINPVCAQNTRGKYELMTLHSLSYLMSDVRRFSWDLSLFMSSEFDFIKLASSHTTGSSIMPNKNNPDIVEMMRAGLSVVEGAIQQTQSLLSLPSGYQRDLQLSKEPILKGMEMTRQTFALLPGLLTAMHFNQDKMTAAITPEMMATDRALKKVLEGQSFRNAYLDSKQTVQSDMTAEQSVAERVSLGGAANLGLDVLKKRFGSLID